MPRILGRTGGGFRVTEALKGVVGIGRGLCHFFDGSLPHKFCSHPHLYRAAASTEEGALPVQHIMWASGLTWPPLITAELKTHHARRTYLHEDIAS
ncbi:hypothetical protein SCLCIDRAFT_981921 [Scleroderma citrinum Foug A]|uniref:Uncharacterized protein n=1 Tax=Scleroderma citrinum Foug A TaxID=1036808 RepID=A0A0C2ZDD5_9AGAM|nr:hypothetical protein SCLCIDRAFT_981921 [Scleroderma citrinum Foug A]